MPLRELFARSPRRVGGGAPSLPALSCPSPTARTATAGTPPCQSPNTDGGVGVFEVPLLLAQGGTDNQSAPTGRADPSWHTTPCPQHRSKSGGTLQAGRAWGTPPSPSGPAVERLGCPLRVGEPTFFVQSPTLRDTSSHHPYRLQGSQLRCSPPGVGAHDSPSQGLAVSTPSGAGTCMFPLRSPYLFQASPTSPKGERSLEPTSAPSDRLPLPCLPPSLSSGGSQRRTASRGQTRGSLSFPSAE